MCGFFVEHTNVRLFVGKTALPYMSESEVASAVTQTDVGIVKSSPHRMQYTLLSL